MLGPRFCARALSSCGKRGPLFIMVRGPLTTTASPVAEHRLQMRRLSNRGSRAQSLRGTRDLPRPGLEPVSPALAGRLSTAAPPGKPCYEFLIELLSVFSLSTSMLLDSHWDLVHMFLSVDKCFPATVVFGPSHEFKGPQATLKALLPECLLPSVSHLIPLDWGSWDFG